MLIKYLIPILFCTTSYAQNDSINKVPFVSFSTKLPSNPNTSSSNYSSSSSSYLSIYNSGTKSNDLYYKNKDSLIYLNSTIDPNNIYRNPKIDSLNPYGASDAKTGLIFGAIGEFFSSIFK